MFEIPMIGEPLLIEENNFFCEHNKIPQVIQSLTYQNPAIRLQEMSRLRKLGERDYHTCHECHECNEPGCECLWLKYDHKPPLPNEQNVLKSMKTSMPREYRAGRGWSLRNQILNKLQESFGYRGNQQRDNKRLKSKDSVIWLMRPTKKLRDSETNILRPDQPKQKQLPQRMHPKSMPYKYQANTQSTGSMSSRTALYNWQAQLARQQAANERIAIEKGTKEYFNKCKKTHEIKLMESQLEKAIYSRYNNKLKKVENAPATQYLSYTKINELNSLEKIFDQQQNELVGNRGLKWEEYFDEVLKTYSGDPPMEQFGHDKLHKCNCEHCSKLKADNFERKEEPSYVDEMYEMASSPSSEGAATYHICSSGKICDYMWLKQTDTQIKLSQHQSEEGGMQISTQTSNIVVVAQEGVSKTSMNVNFSGSCTRMADFESDFGPDEESELAKEKVLTKEGQLNLAKELRSPQEEKAATSVTKIDDAKDATTSSKPTKIPTKKHKLKKLKNSRTKKQRTQPSKTKTKTTIETFKSIENVLEPECSDKELVLPGLSQNIDIDNSFMDLTSPQPDDANYVGLQGTTKQSIKNESYNICYHKPIKYEQCKLFGIYSKKYDEF